MHVVALSDASGRQPDLATVKAFYIPPGKGVCMRPGCWHATQVVDTEVSCLMLTRSSTTVELVAYLERKAPASESALLTIQPSIRLDIGHWTR